MQSTNKTANELVYTYKQHGDMLNLVNHILNVQSWLTLLDAESLEILRIVITLSIGDGLEDSYKKALFTMIDKAKCNGLE